MPPSPSRTPKATRRMPERMRWALLWTALATVNAVAAESPPAAVPPAPATPPDGGLERSFNAPPSAVEVYTQGYARVTRAAPVSLSAGKTRLLTAPLPSSADLSSVTVLFAPEGGGRARTVVVETTYVETTLAKPGDDPVERQRRLRERTAAQTAAQRALARTRERIRALEAESQYAASMRQQVNKFALEGLAKDPTPPPATAEKYYTDAKTGLPILISELPPPTPLAERVRSGHAAVQAMRTIEAEYAERLHALQEEERAGLDAFERESRLLRELQGAPVERAKYENKLAVVLFAEAPARGTLSVAYNARGASWQPVYWGEVDLPGRTLSLDLFGLITQETGEDWNDVALAFSTARPDLGTDVPVLEAWRVGPGAAALAPPETPMPSRPGRRGAEAAFKPDGASASFQAVTRLAGAGTTFHARHKARIASDGRAHRIAGADWTTKFTVEHIAVPKVLPHAFMRATSAEAAPFNLLPGAVELSLDGRYVGRGWMEFTALGETMKLGLGIDENVQAQLKRRVSESDRQVRGGRVYARNVFDVKLLNLSKESVTLTVVDQVPVAMGDSINVTYGLETGKAAEHGDFPGQLKWTRELDAGATDTIAFEFGMDYAEGEREEVRKSIGKIQYRFNNVQNNDIDSALPADAAQQLNPNFTRNAAAASQAVDLTF